MTVATSTNETHGEEEEDSCAAIHTKAGVDSFNVIY